MFSASRDHAAEEAEVHQAELYRFELFLCYESGVFFCSSAHEREHQQLTRSVAPASNKEQLAKDNYAVAGFVLL